MDVNRQSCQNLDDPGHLKERGSHGGETKRDDVVPEPHPPINTGVTAALRLVGSLKVYNLPPEGLGEFFRPLGLSVDPLRTSEDFMNLCVNTCSTLQSHSALEITFRQICKNASFNFR